MGDWVTVALAALACLTALCALTTLLDHRRKMAQMRADKEVELAKVEASHDGRPLLEQVFGSKAGASAAEDR